MIKINRSIVCGFFISASLCLACTPVNSTHAEGAETVGISGIFLGMQERDLLRKLGEPHSREENALGDFTRLDYNGLSIALRANGPRLDSPKTVDGLWATTSEYCYESIICPGTRLSKIRDRLGEANIETATSDKPRRLFYLLPKVEACWLWVYTENDLTASDVRIACQP